MSPVPPFVLDNFTRISEYLNYRKGRELWTQNIGCSVLARAVLDDEIPNDGGNLRSASRLSRLLRNKGTDCVVEFGETEVVVRHQDGMESRFEVDGKVSEYSPPEWGDVTARFTLTREDLETVLKSAKALCLDDVVFGSDGEGIVFGTQDIHGEDKDAASVRLATDGDGTEFEMFFDVDDVKLLDMSNDYDVTLSATCPPLLPVPRGRISSDLVARGAGMFESRAETGAETGADLTYWVSAWEVEPEVAEAEVVEDTQDGDSKTAAGDMKPPLDFTLPKVEVVVGLTPTHHRMLEERAMGGSIEETARDMIVACLEGRLLREHEDA